MHFVLEPSYGILQLPDPRVARVGHGPELAVVHLPGGARVQALPHRRGGGGC